MIYLSAVCYFRYDNFSLICNNLWKIFRLSISFLYRGSRIHVFSCWPPLLYTVTCPWTWLVVGWAACGLFRVSGICLFFYSVFFWTRFCLAVLRVVFNEFWMVFSNFEGVEISMSKIYRWLLRIIVWTQIESSSRFGLGNGRSWRSSSCPWYHSNTRHTYRQTDS